MNLASLHRKLIATARANPPGDKVPYAFEKRVLAHLYSAPVPDVWAEWAASLWRAAVPCILIMFLLTGWALSSAPSPGQPSGPTPDLSQQMENAVFAAAIQDPSADSLW